MAARTSIAAEGQQFPFSGGGGNRGAGGGGRGGGGATVHSRSEGRLSWPAIDASAKMGHRQTTKPSVTKIVLRKNEERKLKNTKLHALSLSLALALPRRRQ